MLLERGKALCATFHERSAKCQEYANGFKPKKFTTRMGTLAWQVPHTRNLKFYPQCIEKRLRSEPALKVSLVGMYLNGVSTRKVKNSTEELCGKEVTSMKVWRAAAELDEEFKKFRDRPLGRFPYVYIDATYLKVRHNGTVIDMTLLIPTGVNQEGRREVMGISMSLSESEVHWRLFLESFFK